MEIDINNFDISQVLTKDLISLNIQSKSKKGAIEELTDLLVEHGDVSDRQGFIDDVLKRETEGMTGLGQGVAIPHGKSLSVANTTLAIGISKNDIAWESLDNKPVNIIILFAVKDTDANTLHIKLLQKVAILLADENFIESLHSIKTKEELIDLFEAQPEEE